MGTALTMYAQDYDETLPGWVLYYVCTTYDAKPAASCGGITPTTWDAILQPYVKSGDPGNLNNPDRNTGVWHCPSAEKANDVRSYGFSMGLAYGSDPADTQYYLKYRVLALAQIQSPASTVFVGDGGSDGRLDRPFDLQGYTEHFISSPKDNYTRSAPWRHQDGGNYVWCDGHAKYMKGDDIYAHPTPPVTATGATAAQKASAGCAYAKYFGVTKGERTYWANYSTTNGTPCTSN